MTSFFQTGGGGLPENHPAYTSRHNLDNDAFNAALNGELLHVIAPRQVGKTSLLKRLRARLLERGWRCVIVDLSTLLGFSMTTWYRELGHKLAVELTPGISLTLTNHLNMSAYLDREAMHEQYGPPRIAVLFDEVESVIKVHDEQGQSFSDAFFMTIRDLYQKRDTRNGLLAIGLAGAMSATYLVKESRISPFNVGQPLSIDDFTLDETIVFTKHLDRLNVAVDDAIYQAIYTWTNGHPYLTHRICAELEKMVHSGQLKEITAGDIESVVKRIFLDSPNPLLEDTNIHHAKKMLKNLPEPARPLWERIRQGTATSRGSVDTETFADLYITGVIKNQDGYLVIRNLIYKEAFTVKTSSESATEVTNRSPLPEPLVEDEFQLSYEPPIFPLLPQTDAPFLTDAERQRMTGLIEHAINSMHEYEIRNILTNCHIPQGVIDHIDYRAGTHTIAHALMWKLERSGTLHPHYQSHALGAFLAYLAEHELVGFDAALEIVILIFKYHLILDQQRVYELSSSFQVPLPASTDPSSTNRRVTLSRFPERIRNEILASQVRERLESLYNRGITHYVDPHFFMGGHQAINAVCRIEFDKRGEGTGFLVAPDLVLTNYHVFRPEGTSYDLHDRARHCQVRFGAMRDKEGSEEPGKLFKLHQNWLVASSDDYALDYLLLRLTPTTHGIIKPVSIAPKTDVVYKDTFVNIIHHPLRGAMEVSLRCNEVVEVEPQRIYYLADTEEGSSGAPVFDDHWRVVALHRSGGEKDASGRLLRKANSGIPIHLIMNKITRYLSHI